MSTTTLALIPLLPLLAATITSGIQCGRRSAGIAVVAMLGSCVLALMACNEAWGMELNKHITFDIPWITVGDTIITFGFVLDPLTGVMAAMVTFVGLFIFIYSVGYMAKDERMARFFCYLSLFAAGMLGLILANNLLLLFMCWEIVGVASYLLISFWFHKPEAAAAGKKAFIVTRIGDMGFLIGILIAFKSTGTLTLYDGGNGLLETEMGGTIFGFQTAAVVSLLLFLGAMGKSGQVPLHVWLPDAMEGPTPVSALIHAATMVAAGVFLVARTMPIFEAGGALPVVAWTGAITALVAAFIALGQYDIKRILAYSTVSQLGLMMVGLGVGMGGVAIGMFHLLTHAFFKALLFLGAGSIIHGCHEEQDIRKMGGVWKSMRITSIAYLCGTAALVAFPFTSGFFSKDEILAGAWATSKPIFWIAAAASLLTAVYMTRQCLYVFIGSYRGEHAPHESPRLMTVPLIILAVFALGLGALAHGTVFDKLPGVAAKHETIVIVISVVVALGGIALGWLVYRGRKLGVDTDPLAVRPLREKLWFDEYYADTVEQLWKLAAITWEQLNELLLFLRDMFVAVVQGVSSAFAVGGDRKLIDTLAFDGLCDWFRSLGYAVTRPQNGFLPSYLRLIAIGAVALGLMVFWMS